MRILITEINALGDAVAFLPTLQAIASSCPDVQVTMVCSQQGFEVFSGAAENVRFRVVDARDVRSFTALASTVIGTAARFDLALHAFDVPAFAYALSAALLIKKRVGYASGISRAEFLLTDRLPLHRDRNVVEINFDLARWLLRDEQLRPRRTPVAVPADDCSALRKKLRLLSLDVDDDFIVIHPGAKHGYRRWSLWRFMELARRIEGKSNLPVIFVAHEGNGEFIGTRVVDGLSIKQLACLLRAARLVICNNSGPMHMAAAAGTPSVVVQGPSAYNWDIHWSEVAHEIVRVTEPACVPCERLDFVPKQCHNRRTPMECMESISVDMVEEAVSRVLDSSGLRRAVNPYSSGIGLTASGSVARSGSDPLLVPRLS